MIQHEHALGFRTEIKHKIEHTKTEYLVEERVKAGLNTLSYQTKISRGFPNPGTTTDGAADSAIAWRITKISQYGTLSDF